MSGYVEHVSFDDARLEMKADQAPLEPRYPWINTMLGLLAASGLLATLGL